MITGLKKYNIMDAIEVKEAINQYDGQSVYISTVDGKTYVGMLQVKTVLSPNGKFRRVLLVGWREEAIEIDNVSEIRLV